MVKSVHKRADVEWPICGHQELTVHIRNFGFELNQDNIDLENDMIIRYKKLELEINLRKISAGLSFQVKSYTEFLLSGPEKNHYPTKQKSKVVIKIEPLTKRS